MKVVLSPVNILEFTASFRGDVETSADDNAPETWRRLRKHLRALSDRTELTHVSFGQRREYGLMLTVETEERIRVQVREGEELPPPAEVEAQLGMIPGKRCTLTGAQLGTLISAHLADGGRAFARPLPAAPANGATRHEDEQSPQTEGFP
jgi:hypothetical protein